jgi:hypothetical protein
VKTGLDAQDVEPEVARASNALPNLNRMKQTDFRKKMFFLIF